MPQSRMPAVSRVQEVFDQVLSAPEFRERTSAPIVDLLVRLLDTIDGLLERFLPNVGEEQVRLVSWALLVASACIGVVVVWRWLSSRSLAPSRGARRGPAATPPRSAEGWAEWARSEARGGRLREAATGLYQAVILDLETKGTVRYGEWKTPGDYAVEVSADSALRGPLRGFLAHFVTIAFGHAEPTEEALDALFARAERLGCPT